MGMRSDHTPGRPVNHSQLNLNRDILIQTPVAPILPPCQHIPIGKSSGKLVLNYGYDILCVSVYDWCLIICLYVYLCSGCFTSFKV